MENWLNNRQSVILGDKLNMCMWILLWMCFCYKYLGYFTWLYHTRAIYSDIMLMANIATVCLMYCLCI